MNHKQIYPSRSGVVRTYSLMLIALAIALTGCSSAPAQKQSYDFGPLSAPASTSTSITPILAISLADINAPASLDSTAMLYRLQYDNAQQARPYAQHRWSMPPAQLLTQRLKTRIAAAGGTVIASRDAVSSLSVLQMDLDEFSQVFSSASSSTVQIQIRATVFKGRNLLAQRSFQQQVVTPTADAPGGAKAMVTASDALISDVMAWMQTLRLN
ncbi:ABC-type transport auxiliary lipoprotein family protein [Undibacterium sp. RTI2.1]|uniref:ABC-type transport auxiliary lipoprotein family protein n=1 Tax=unclassified Undibacterium TaxID=2630295 RepID=UPI002AB37650|nr:MULTISPECIES: ABC-type transport auxiliary lipoprotein family protein [unclassified Undibacterium]MDY7539309.1 ABC-type transport auxiliary lipoprotein family protein [Undibacterium sp. 5I1]MEB0031411.1 ABC-type transport auxiliary lipoprotein family protein [Undibacterium sp. RTI2.1]MEB0117758.1 ABC-type transport auxiliary lipoprotein family protein [Undibacterium sp. RTI2.2]MEB0232774.1 ABC-type transport auxiliary lipoprotein family protein [Undibacterium sp. 10I3]MEB0259526.1 ABC-type 